MRTGLVLSCSLGLALLGCNGFSKLDWSHLGRATWQRPDDVIAALELDPGDQVVDLGAGDGYFVPYLAEAVPDGKVYAVEIGDEELAELESRFGEDPRVSVVHASPEDPQLPDGAIDVILVVNVYHHIEQRQDYFDRLRGDLAPDGRIAIVESDPEMGGLLGLFVPEDHGTSTEDLDREMSAAGYRKAGSHDFLPLQNLEVYAPSP